MHKMIVVIMPPQEARNPEAYVEKIMVPFDVNFDVKPYEVDCYCWSGKRFDLPPLPGCALCGGTGRTTSTHNTEGYWDNWEIGGVWAGWMVGVSTRNLTLVGRDNPFLNMAGGDYVPKTVVAEASAVVLPTGKWHDLVPSQLTFPTAKPLHFDTFRKRHLDHVFVVCDAHSQS